MEDPLATGAVRRKKLAEKLVAHTKISGAINLALFSVIAIYEAEFSPKFLLRSAPL